MKDKLKSKVIAGFVLATLLVGVVSFFTISNFLQLQNSISILSRPDLKSSLISKLLADISETESLVRSYTITGKDKYLDLYYINGQMIREEIDSLKSLTRHNVSQRVKVDSISVLWNNKLQNFDDYISLKTREKQRDFSGRAISKIARQAVDSVQTTRTTKSTDIAERLQVAEEVIQPYEPVEKEENKRDLKGLAKLIDNIFSSKEKKQESVVAEADSVIVKDTLKTISEKQIRYDTVIVKEDASSIINKVVSILSDLKEQEERFSTLVTSREYELLQDDVLIMENIRIMIRELLMEEKALEREQNSQSKAFAEQSIRTIFIIGIAALLVSVVFMYLIITDITRSNFYKQRLEKAKRKAEKLARVKEDFLANMSHEIRTPLSAIIGFTNQLAGTELREKQRYYLQAVQNSSGHLLNTVNDILDFSKIEAGKVTLEHQTFRLLDVLKEVIELFSMKAAEKGIKLRLDDNTPSGIVLSADPFRIKQILINLLGNAIKFTDRGEVVLSSHLPGNNNNELILTVKDTGTGIPSKKLHAIFKGFEQADSSTTRQYGGTGLGLAISRRLARIMQGDLTVTSEMGRGSEFTLSVPVKTGKEENIKPVNTKTAIDVSVLEGLKILVADDDEYNILLFHTILQKWKVKVELAGNGREAYELIQKNTYDLILTDQNMPEMSGLELLRKIRKDRKDYDKVPVLCITANVFAHKTDTEFNDFILKPFTELQLYQKITKALSLTGKNDQPPVQPAPIHEAGSGISLHQLNQFAGGDQEMLKKMVQDLINNGRSGIYQLHMAAEKGDLERLSSVAHKMIPTFAHVEAYEIASRLKVLDQAIHTLALPQARQIVREVREMSKEMFEQLEETVTRPHEVKSN